MTARNDIFATITDKLVTLLEAGTNPWRGTWKSDGSSLRAGLGQHRNALTGRAYRGLNVLILQLAADAAGYSSTGWLTPRQAMGAGLNIKGTKCVQVTFWKKTTRVVTGADGSEETKGGMFVKTYNVLNVDQLNLTADERAQLHGLVDAPVVPMTRHALADTIEQGMGVSVRHGGDRAFYAPSVDAIQMPAFETFEGEGAYCATLSHEAIHATGSKTRLDREFGKRFGDDAYAFEELVAELGAAFVGAVTGHSNEVSNHASYLASWLRILKADSKAVLTAASKAQAAADLVLTALTVDDEDEADDVAIAA